MPMTSPARLNIGPPELPRFIEASVCKKSSYGPEWMSRAVAEMMPAVTLPPRPKGLPIASTQSPTRVLLESPHAAAGSGVLGSTFKTARSVTGSRPITCACNVVSSDSVTVICSAVAMTRLLVTIRPDESMMKPDPSEATRPRFGAPGVPLSPKKSRKKSSSDGADGFCGASCAFLAAGAGARVEMLTTTPTRRPASCANTSAKAAGSGAVRLGAAVSDGLAWLGAALSDCCGVLGIAVPGGWARFGGAGSCGCVRPGATPPASNAKLSTIAAPRRPKTLTAILPLPPAAANIRSGGRDADDPRRRRPGSGAGLSDTLDMEWRRQWQDRIEVR